MFRNLNFWSLGAGFDIIFMKFYVRDLMAETQLRERQNDSFEILYGCPGPREVAFGNCWRYKRIVIHSFESICFLIFFHAADSIHIGICLLNLDFDNINLAGNFAFYSIDFTIFIQTSCWSWPFFCRRGQSCPIRLLKGLWPQESWL